MLLVLTSILVYLIYAFTSPSSEAEILDKFEGDVLFQGTFDQVKSNENVIEAYLGKGIKK